jgi:hypothetical protein
MMPDNWAGIVTAGKDERKDFSALRESAKTTLPPPQQRQGQLFGFSKQFNNSTQKNNAQTTSKWSRR